MLRLAERNARDDAIAVATSHRSRADEAVAEIRSALADHDLALLIVYFGPRYDAPELARELAAAFPGVQLAGCSTAGEMTPEGMCNNSVVALGLDRSGFTVVTRCMTGISRLSMRKTRQFAADALRELRETRSRAGYARLPRNHDAEDAASDRVFALLHTDGMSPLEEKLVAGLSGSFVNVPLIGGSAGDGLRFRRTHVIHNGQAHTDAAVFALVSCRFPLMTFSSSHFSPTPVKLVVTSADVDRRIVRELNGAPAASEYAAALGLGDKPLSPQCFAAHPLAVRVGGRY